MRWWEIQQQGSSQINKQADVEKAANRTNTVADDSLFEDEDDGCSVVGRSLCS